MIFVRMDEISSNSIESHRIIQKSFFISLENETEKKLIDDYICSFIVIPEQF